MSVDRGRPKWLAEGQTGAFDRTRTLALIEGFSHFVTSMTAPIASGWSDCRVGLAPTGKRRLCTAHTQHGHWLERPASPILIVRCSSVAARLRHALGSDIECAEIAKWCTSSSSRRSVDVVKNRPSSDECRRGAVRTSNKTRSRRTRPWQSVGSLTYTGLDVDAARMTPRRHPLTQGSWRRG